MTKRSGTGQSFIMLMIAVGFVILPAIGFFAFEISTANLAQQQLQNAVDAAALTAAAELASSTNPSSTGAQTDASQAALKIFQQNLVLGTKLTETVLSSTTDGSPAAGDALLCIQYLASGAGAEGGTSSIAETSKMLKVGAAFGATPAFGRYLGLSTYTVRAGSAGALPPLDIVVCFDVSGSIDDQTPVTFVTRKWDPVLGKIVYKLPPGKHGSSGKIYDVIQPSDKGGTRLNALPPQCLSAAYDSSDLYFSEGIQLHYAAEGYPYQPLRALGGYPEAGKLPGNHTPGRVEPWKAWDAEPIFTDMVVNLDNNPTFGSFSKDGFSFPNVATLVEACRGNLESAAALSSSKANTGVTVAAKPGYQAKYLEAARDLLQPLTDARTAALAFIDSLAAGSDAHISLIAFDDKTGTGPSSTKQHYDIDDDIWGGLLEESLGVMWNPAPPYGAQKEYPLPMVPLDTGSSGVSDCKAALGQCVPLGSTNIGMVLEKAVNELKSRSRTGAKRAIVLFTDGQPTEGTPLDADPLVNARKAAVLAKNEGIPIYTVGLAQNAEIVADETAILNDTNDNPDTGGIAGISGHGATFNLVNNSTELEETFKKIARRLVEVLASAG